MLRPSVPACRRGLGLSGCSDETSFRENPQAICGFSRKDPSTQPPRDTNPTLPQAPRSIIGPQRTGAAAVIDLAALPCLAPPYRPSIHAVDAPSGALSATCAAIWRTRSAFVKGDQPWPFIGAPWMNSPA